MSIRTKLILPLVLLSMILGLAGSVIVLRQFDSLEHSFVSLFVQGRVRDMEKSVQEKSESALQLAALFSRMPVVVEAFQVAARGDMNDETDLWSQAAREELRDSLAPVLRGYEEALGGKLRVHFHLPTARSLLRTWRDMQAKRDGEWVDVSDDLSDFRETVIQVNQTGEPVMGIEPGRGGFTIRGLAPVTAPDGSHLGSVEVLVGFQSVLDTLEADGMVRSLLFMDAGLLDITTSLRDPDKYPLLKNKYVLLHGKEYEDVLALADVSLLDGAEQGSRTLIRGGLALGISPVRDYQGKAIGVVVLSQDIGPQQAMISRMLYVVGATLLLVMLVPLAVVLWIFQRGVMRPVARAVAFTGEMSRGDLSHRLEVRARDEVGVLAGAMNTLADSLEYKAGLARAIADNDLTAEVRLDSDQDALGLALREMTRNLNELLGAVRRSAEDVNSASDQVSSTSQSLSQGATEQAASLEEISASLTEITGQTKKNAANAASARDMSRQVRDRVGQSRENMTAMVEAMAEVTESSEAIAKIIKVIDEIAFQTNLLALNAAVEAARAGEHGKGFSVVAGEVRNLAGRSAKAAQETAELIDSSVDRVRHTNQTVGQAVEGLEAVAQDVGGMAGLVDEIAQASLQQSQALAEVSEGLHQVDQVVQNNTANSEETSAAAQQLSSQADTLTKLVRRFRLKGGPDEAEGDAVRGVPAPATFGALEHDPDRNLGPGADRDTWSQDLPQDLPQDRPQDQPASAPEDDFQDIDLGDDSDESMDFGPLPDSDPNPVPTPDPAPDLGQATYQDTDQDADQEDDLDIDPGDVPGDDQDDDQDAGPVPREQSGEPDGEDDFDRF